jgi:hypothetical protein
MDNRPQITDNGPQTVSNINAAPMVGGQWSVVRFFAHFFSYVFHPLFVPLYVLLFLMYVHPSYFSGIDDSTKSWLAISVAYTTIFFPAFTVLLSKGLGFIGSVFLRTQKDRIIPYIASGIFYFWMFRVCANHPASLNPIVPSFMLGVFLAASVALIANIYFKISMHAIGMGGWLGIFLLIMESNTMLMTWPLCLVLLITGIVCTSRLLISDHRPKEIYAGLVVGLLCQFAAAVVFL